DGVHRGHRELLRAAVADAHARGLEAIAISFEPHPSRILTPQAAPRLITPREEKTRRLADCGLDALLLLPFSRDLSLWSPLEFVERILVRGLRVAAVYEGENFRFGHRGQGSGELLRQLGAEFGFAVHIEPRLEVDGAPVSSSRLREQIGAGRVAEAARLLGRPFAVAGLIAPGRGVGRQRTVPTLNLQHYEELLPAIGVYLTRANCLPALTNVGVRPTFGPGGPLTVESHLLHPPAAGLSVGLGERLEIAFLDRLRDERKFDSPEALRTQIQQDIATATRFFAAPGQNDACSGASL
ncbi:MAG: bifunctional riboflavin kinase/FMN adenylyltransferase, partial [Terriglobales bacterium]